MYYQQGLWSGKHSFILNQEVSGSIPLGYGVTFVRERFTPQGGTSRHEFGFSRTPIWVPDTGWKTKKKGEYGFSRAPMWVLDTGWKTKKKVYKIYW
ncbi:hypothetical protein H5410_001171 [Solanum commersonii]|uniref:Uncharacterized protein n=1 Tax=Solanum commersonii TaxID=4109 RepID=A0A9J6AY62_SOLCO|nr:hypothetical protein H5410_001171 [Solanum commersonii]